MMALKKIVLDNIPHCLLHDYVFLDSVVLSLSQYNFYDFNDYYLGAMIIRVKRQYRLTGRGTCHRSNNLDNSYCH